MALTLPHKTCHFSDSKTCAIESKSLGGPSARVTLDIREILTRARQVQHNKPSSGNSSHTDISQLFINKRNGGAGMRSHIALLPSRIIYRTSLSPTSSRFFLSVFHAPHYFCEVGRSHLSTFAQYIFYGKQNVYTLFYSRAWFINVTYTCCYTHIDYIQQFVIFF